MLALLAVIALTVALRAPGLDRPLLGNFATKSAVFGMIARNWAEGRAPWWYPTLDVLAEGRRSLHMLEMPVSAYLTGALWRVFGGPLDAWGRATSVAFYAAAVAVLFLYVRRRHGPRAALAAALTLALSPVGVIYGQSFMLDASLVFFTVATFDAADRWLAGARPVWLATAAACFALLLLTKVYLAVLLVPLGWSIVRPGTAPVNGRARLAAAAALGLAVLPAAAWCSHAARTAAPESALAPYVFDSVRKSAEVYCPPDPLLRSPDFYRRVLDDLTGVVLTPVGFVLLLAGLLDRAWRRYAAWLACMVLLVVLLPRKFAELNYYWVAVLPPLCVLAGLGWGRVCGGLRPGRRAQAGLLAVALVLSLRYAARPAFVTPEEDRPVPEAAAAVRALTPPEEPVATMHGSTIDLLYYCDRPGWAVPPDAPGLEARLDDFRRQGARLLVVAGPAAADPPGPLRRLRAIERGPGWAVLGL